MQFLWVAVAATITFNPLPSPATAGWQGAVWGMTPEQVSAAVPGVRAVHRGETLSNARKQGVRDSELYGVALQASYFYSPEGLTFIRFNVPFRRCETVVGGLVAEHGHPSKVSEQAILRVIVWDDPESGNRLSLIHSASGICDLRIRSIHDTDNGLD